MQELNKFIKQKVEAGKWKVYDLVTYDDLIRHIFLWYNLEVRGGHLFVGEKREKPNKKRERRLDALDQVKTKIKQNITKTYYSAFFYTLKK